MQKQDRRKICRYYTKGRCVKQDCPFVHQQQTKKPCKFYTQSGYCRKGKNCQFYHATQDQFKKDKLFMERNQEKNNNKQQNYENKAKQSQKSIHSNINKIFQQETFIRFQQKQQKPIIKKQQKKSPIVLTQSIQQLRIQQQQLINQLTLQLKKYQQSLPQHQTLSFKHNFPHSFPDNNKTLQKKQYIKSIEQKFFKPKTFLQIINSFDQQKQKHKIQYYQIIRRYQDSFRLENQDEANVYIVSIRPLLYTKEMLLLFKIQQQSQRVIIKVDQRQYPSKFATFQILNKSIPQPYKIKFNQFLNKFHIKNSIFTTLKYLQNNFEKVYTLIKQKLEIECYKIQELKKKITYQMEVLQEIKIKEIQQKNRQKYSKMIKEKEGGKQEKDTKEEQKNQENQIKEQKKQIKQNKQQSKPQLKSTKSIKSKTQQPKHQTDKIIKQYRDYIQLQFGNYQKPQHQNLNDQITVQSLIMQNCPYMVIQKMLLYLQCNCSKNIMYLFDANQKKQLKLWIKLKCKKCNDCMRIVWQRQVIQYKTTTICKMSIVNGKIIDIGGLGWKIGCQCDQQILKNKLYLPGQRLQINCHSCFQNMNITYNGIKFYNPFIKQFQMQQQKQLPMKGACNHDKLNFKWTRYACCGRPFSCDQCHDLGSIKNHQIMNGITMICGYCSYEQTVSNQCTKCKKQLIKGIDKAGHWEGGLGCRDKNLLSRKDAKKYAGNTKQPKQKK